MGLAVAAQEYVVSLKHWGVKEGLSHRTVRCIYQDRDGMIWIATPASLQRFDGYKFTTVGLEGNPFSHYRIDVIAQDAAGNLWLEREDGSIAIFNPLTRAVKTFEQVTGAKNLKAVSIQTMADYSILLRVDDTKGNIFYNWLPGRGMHQLIIPDCYRYINMNPERNCLLLETPQGLLAEMAMNGRVTKTAAAPFCNGIPALNFRQGTNWQPDGFFISDSFRTKYYRVTLDLQIDTTSFINFHSRPDLSSDMFLVGNDGAIWWQNKLVTMEGRVVADFSKNEMLEYGQFAHSVLTDREGNTWFGNEMGLYMITARKSRFKKYYLNPQGNPQDNSGRGLQVIDGKLYVHNEFVGTYGIDLKSGAAKVLVNNEMSHGYGLQKIGSGILSGINALIRRNGEVVLYPHNKALYLSNKILYQYCWYVYELNDTTCLAGAEAAGLYYFYPATGRPVPFTAYGQFPELAHSTVYYIAPDRQGDIWICSSSGFYRYDGSRGIVERYSDKDSGAHYLPAENFQHFSQDATGVFWLATIRGLIRWQNGASRLYTEADGLSNNNIYAVYPDRNNCLWMSSDYGIMRMNTGTGKITAFTQDEGITNNEFNRVSHCRDSSGNIYFGSLNGITAFNPADFSDSASSNEQSPLTITSFLQFSSGTGQLEDRLVALLNSKVITMQPDDRFFTLEFALLDYKDPQRTTYYWKVDDIDTTWHAQNERTLSFTRLSYGQHTLHITAREADGTPAINEIILTIEMVKPFYLRTGFIMGIVLLVGAAGFAGYRWRVHQLKRENARLDWLVQEKTASLSTSLQQKEVLIKEMHHRVKNNLQVISSMLRMQSRYVKDEAATAALLEGCNRVESIALVHRKLYQDDHPEAINLFSFAEDMFRQIKSLYNRPDAALDNKLPQALFSINIAIPLGLILNELFTNSFKYAFTEKEPHIVQIEMEEEKGAFTLQYTDFYTKDNAAESIEQTESMGLKLLRILARQLSGSVVISHHPVRSVAITFKG